MSDVSELLFVYGTLLSEDTGATSRAQRARLGREALVCGAATVEGSLYDLGRYPGLVVGTLAAGKVHGEVLELVRAAHTLAWLDVYEGIVPGEHPHTEYERRRLTALLTTGETVEAWVYVYLQPTLAARLIPGGDWLRR